MKNRSIFVAAALLTFAISISAAIVASSDPLTSGSAWTWMSGSNTINQLGRYGTQGVTSAGSVPGSRVNAVSGIDRSGKFWLFGGFGNDSSNAQGGDLNDLWTYSGGKWTWVSGSNSTEQAGVYGIRELSAPTDVPGARYQAASWTDSAGDFWVFGGLGIDEAGTRGRLNDLWKYSDGEWTWMSGSKIVDQPGQYGTKGVAAPENTPGARVGSSTWTDASGALWLFGGFGYDSNGNLGNLNDLWKYTMGEWTWMSGSPLSNQFGRYGNRGTASPHNVPGARSGAATWIDATGNLWLFGGQGNDASGVLCSQSVGVCNLNDLWKYSAGEWIWVSGAQVINRRGIYGTRGEPNRTNFPGARANAMSWVTAAGDFWLFGGFGFDSSPKGFGDLNDLWKFSDGKWTWMNGSTTADQLGIYGEKHERAPGNIPGARDGAVSWIDTNGNLWLFGGGDFLSVGNGGKFNDLWKYSVIKTPIRQ